MYSLCPYKVVWKLKSSLLYYNNIRKSIKCHQLWTLLHLLWEIITVGNWSSSFPHFHCLYQDHTWEFFPSRLCVVFYSYYCVSSPIFWTIAGIKNIFPLETGANNFTCLYPERFSSCGYLPNPFPKKTRLNAYIMWSCRLTNSIE